MKRRIAGREDPWNPRQTVLPWWIVKREFARCKRTYVGSNQRLAELLKSLFGDVSENNS